MIRRVPASVFFYYEPREILAFLAKRGIAPVFTLDPKEEDFFVSDWKDLKELTFKHLTEVPIRNPHYTIGAYLHALNFMNITDKPDFLAYQNLLRRDRKWWILTRAVRGPIQEKEVKDYLKRGICPIEIPPGIGITEEELEAEVVPYLTKEKPLPKANLLYAFYWAYKFKMKEDTVYPLLCLGLNIVLSMALVFYVAQSHNWLLLLALFLVPLCAWFLTGVWLALVYLFIYRWRILRNAKHFIGRAFRFARDCGISLKAFFGARNARSCKQR